MKEEDQDLVSKKEFIVVPDIEMIQIMCIVKRNTLLMIYQDLPGFERYIRIDIFIYLYISEILKFEILNIYCFTMIYVYMVS